MAEFILEANERKADKQSQLTDIRTSSRVPGIIYGFSQKPVSIDVDYRELLKVLKEAGTSNIISIKVGTKEIKTIVREYQQNPVSDKITHVDFMAVDAKKKVNTKVPLEFIGESTVVREQGGQLNKKALTVNVTCLPADLPAKIEIDISVLKELGQKLLIRDLKVDAKVTITNDPNDPVVNVTMPKKMQLKSLAEEAADTAAAEAATAAAEAATTTAEGEVKTEEKK
ncbi:MAG: 50S ribosomal protein L25 [Patescibacteria group bacterium]|jgi:large subunit ribosomal protein L25